MSRFSPQQQRIIAHLEAGASRKEMAGAIGISINTVGFHLKRIYLKTGAHDRVQALNQVRRANLIAA